jgi:hypothetical protein
VHEVPHDGERMRLRLGAGFFWTGPGWPCGPERDRWIHVLEEYQHDLEQAAADVADVIRRVREDTGSGPFYV